MEGLILIVITVFVAAISVIVLVLNIIQNSRNKKIKKILENLEIEKNKIDSAPIIPELSKIKSFLKNDKLETMYNDWKKRLEIIKSNQIPKLTDMLLEADYSISQLDYKGATYKLAKLEMEVYRVRTNSEFLLGEIKEITGSEEKNRAIITNFKTNYRELYQKFNDNKNNYGEIENSISLQFENIAKRFENFESAMENNEYTEVTQIIKAIDDMLKHITVILDEVPAIILMAGNILPKKMKDIEEIYNCMLKEDYPLDYLNVEYNLNEAKSKISDILDRTRVLNLEDNVFELKVLIEYFESLYNDFDKERLNRQEYDGTNQNFKKKLDQINELVDNIFAQIGDIRNIYNLSDNDVVLLNEVKQELKDLNNDYKTLINHIGNTTFAYSKLTKEIEGLYNQLIAIENRLDTSLDAIGSMREDEVRARQQLEEVKVILKEAKMQIREYNLPVVPKSYFTELNEASSAIKEIVKELEKKPITICVLNTRVDTARDLVLKLYSKTKEMMKTAMFAEMAIVYGNRYRTTVDDLDKYLTYSELLFYKGEYQKSLELTISFLNKIEPSIYNKLLNLYGKEVKQ